MWMVTELGSEVKLTPPDEVHSFHVQHLPHPHSVIRNHGAVQEAAMLISSQVRGDFWRRNIHRGLQMMGL